MASLGYATLSEMQDQIGLKVRDTSTAQRRISKDNMNMRYSEYAREYEWPELVRSDDVGLRDLANTTLTTADSAETFFPGPWDAQEILSLTVYTPTAVCLEEITATRLAAYTGSQRGVAGLPLYYAEVGKTAQYQQLTIDSVLTFRSSSTGNDSIARTIRVVYSTSTAHLGRTTLEELDGTFGTANFVDTAGTAGAGWPIQEIHIPKDWVGDLTVEDSAGNVIVDIPPIEGGGTASEQWQVLSRPLYKCAPIQNNDYKGTWVWKRLPSALREPTDVPEIPVSDVLVLAACSDYYADAQEPQLSVMYDQKAERALKRISGANRIPRGGAFPRGGNILGMTGIRGTRDRRSRLNII